MTGPSECACGRPHATIQTAHIVYARTPGRALRISVAAAGHEPRITVVADDGGKIAAGGFLGLRDVRRVARALATGSGKTHVALRPCGQLTGGRLCVEQDGDDVYLVAKPLNGRPTLFGPVPTVALSAVCRDVVGWNRLLLRSGVAVGANG